MKFAKIASIVFQVIVFITMLLGLVTIVVVFSVGDVLFWSLCEYCLNVANTLNMSLQDTYTIIFAFMMPTVLLTLLALVAAKFLYRVFHPRWQDGFRRRLASQITGKNVTQHNLNQ